MIDFQSLFLVILFALIGGVLMVGLFAVAIRLLATPSQADVHAKRASGTADVARDEEMDDANGASRPLPATIGAYICFAFSGATVLFALYLIIPYFHH